MFIIKLGGSVITKKTEENCFLQDVMNRLSKEIKDSKKDVIIVHGAGSFGHILAKKFKLNDGYTNDNQLIGFSKTHYMVQTLNSYVLKSLHDQNIPAVSIPPHAIMKLEDHKLSKFDYCFFDTYLEKHFTPVTFGDVVIDKKLGFSICSGDLLVLALTGYFKPEKVIFVMDEDGLFTSNPKLNKDAKLIEKTSVKELKRLSVSQDDHADVTRGMEGKIDMIKNIAKHKIDTILLNGNKPDRLYDILVGKDAKCTIVYGE